MVNKVILLGNVGKDPEVKYLESGSAVASFSLATTERWKDNQGEVQSATEWHDCEVWEGLAKVVEQYVKAGTKLYIEGKLKKQTWQDNDGNQKSRIKIRVTNLSMVGNKQESSEEKTKPSQSKPLSPPSPQNQPAIQDEDEDDLPF